MTSRPHQLRTIPVIAMIDLAILDVGHGNSALIVDESHVTLIDASLGSTVGETLRAAGISRINTVIISHADADHCGGLVGLLLDEGLVIDAVRLNSDAIKATVLWNDLTRAMQDARRRASTRIMVGLTSDTQLSGHAEFRLEVLGPDPTLAAKGPGSTDHEGRRLTANSMSAIVRVWRRGVPVALFPGDIDGVGLDSLLREHPDPIARLVVFPHHGGSPGGGASARHFARRLCAAVKPETVVFSLKRGKLGNPLPAIILGVRDAVPNAHIICTQLSSRCAAELPAQRAVHLSDRIAKGAYRNLCCGGTIVLNHEGATVLRSPSKEEHARFVLASAPSALCMEHSRAAAKAASATKVS
jgi:hypothetical protein